MEEGERKAMDKTLYVSDLDGTLLTPREDLSPFTIRVLNRLVEQGMAFTYATARSQHSADVVTRGLTKSLPVIIYNGAFIRRGEMPASPNTCRARATLGPGKSWRSKVSRRSPRRMKAPL